MGFVRVDWSQEMAWRTCPLTQGPFASSENGLQYPQAAAMRLELSMCVPDTQKMNITV